MPIFQLQQLFNFNTSSEPAFIIFTEFLNNRLLYTLDFLIKRKWQSNYIITQDPVVFSTSDKLKINYSKKYYPDAINVLPKTLLQNTGIDTQYTPDFAVHADHYYSEDIFEHIFFCISRYEEWQVDPGQYDQHKRFEAHHTVFQSLLPFPYLDKAINEFEHYISKIYPSYKFPYIYQELYTFDLDNILAFKGKSLYRSMGGLLKSLVRREFKVIKERLNTLYFQKRDPFEEVFDFIRILAHQHPVVFFVLCRSNTAFDRSTNLNHPDTVKVLNELKQFAIIGLHPSYYSSDQPSLIEKEKQALEKILQQPILASRQHYLRMNIRTTPKLLLKNGIHYDFTMGFATRPGFRSGTSYPFYYYDFEKEMATDLLFVPFCIMDGSYFNYQNLPIEKTLEEIRLIKSEITRFGGYFIPLLHEITLCPLFQKDALHWRNLLITEH